MTGAVLAVAVVVAGVDDDAARVVEESAFAALEAKRWCDAVGLFVEADRLAPSAELVVNAAQAAEVAGDRAQALALYARALGRGLDGARSVEVRQRIDAVAQLVTREGAGRACPGRVAAPPPQPPALTPVVPPADFPEPPEPEPVAEEFAPATEDQWVAPKPEWAAGADKRNSVTVPVLPWALGCTGCLGTVGGGGCLASSLSLFFSHEATVADIRDAEERDDIDEAVLLQAQREAYRDAWETTGILTATIGAAVLAGGIALIVGAVAVGVDGEAPK